MSDPTARRVGDIRERLRVQLAAALVLADRCDPLVAIHVETAIALLERGPRVTDQSNDRCAW